MVPVFCVCIKRDRERVSKGKTPESRRSRFDLGAEAVADEGIVCELPDANGTSGGAVATGANDGLPTSSGVVAVREDFWVSGGVLTEVDAVAVAATAAAAAAATASACMLMFQNSTTHSCCAGTTAS